MNYDTLEPEGLNMPWAWATWQWWALMLLIILSAPFWVCWIQSTMDWLEKKSHANSYWWANWRKK